MSEEAEPEVTPIPAGGEDEGETNTENAGSTPLPPSTREEEAEETKVQEGEQEVPPACEEQPEQAVPEVNTEAPPEGTPPAPAPGSQPLPPPSTTVDKSYSYGFRPGAENLPLTINHVAISASAQNKLPVNKVKGIVLRVGRHTESSAQKHGGWYRSPTYVDKDSYTWRNMPLFDDFQRHLWTPDGTVRSSYKK